MSKKVVIIGHGYTSRLGIIRSLSALDCEITVIAMVFNGKLGRFIRFEGIKPLDCYSKYVNRVFYCPVTDGEGLINILLSRCTDPKQKVVIIPDSDFSAAVIDNNRLRLKEHFVFPGCLNANEDIEYWMDKTRQKQLARSVGLHVAEGCVVSIRDGFYHFPTSVLYPCFTKAKATISGGKQFLRRCNDEMSLRKVLDKVAEKYNTEVLIEEFKQIDIEYAVVGFSDGNSVVIPGIIEFIANSKSHFGIAREGKVMPITGFESLLEMFKEFVKRIGFCGLFDIDFYKSGGIMYFSEINLRFGGSGFAVTAMGVNLPAIMVLSMIGEPFDNMPKMVEGTATYVNERMCVDDFVYGYLTKEEYNKIVSETDIRFVYDDHDPRPQRKLDQYVRMQFINRLRKRLRKRKRI